MKLEDLILYIPGALIGTLSKTIRTNIPEVIKDYIEKEHLYHFTKKENIEKIIESRIHKTYRRDQFLRCIWESCKFYVCR